MGPSGYSMQQHYPPVNKVREIEIFNTLKFLNLIYLEFDTADATLYSDWLNLCDLCPDWLTL